jgi:hypothetical protein
VGVGVGVGVDELPPPPPHPIPAVRTARTTMLSKARHLRRRAGMPHRKTQARVAPPLAANQPRRRVERPAALIELLAEVDATMVSVAVVFPLTVTEVGLRLQVKLVGPVHARPTEALKPLIEPRFNVAVPVALAATVTTGVCATKEKSERGLDSDKLA